jgi:hypothetical protein
MLRAMQNPAFLRFEVWLRFNDDIAVLRGNMTQNLRLRYFRDFPRGKPADRVKENTLLLQFNLTPASMQMVFAELLRAKPPAPMTAATRKSAIDQVDRRRRRHPRYHADFRVTASFLEGNRYRSFEGRCSDLSEAGIGMLVAAEMSNGEVVGLSFSLPNSPNVWELRAVVRYRRGYHYGFEFLSLTTEQRETLKKHLNGLKPLDG